MDDHHAGWLLVVLVDYNQVSKVVLNGLLHDGLEVVALRKRERKKKGNEGRNEEEDEGEEERRRKKKKK